MLVFPLPVLLSTIVLLLAICLELVYVDRLSFVLSVFLKRQKRYFLDQKQLYQFCEKFVRVFTYTSLLCVTLIHLYAATLEIFVLQSPTKSFVLLFIKALVAYSSIIAIVIAKDPLSQRWLAICLILSNLFLFVTLESEDLVFFVLGMELTNLPFLLLIFRTNITNMPILGLTSHHLLAFIMIVASLALITPFLQTVHTITFSAYVLSQTPEILYSLSIVLLLLSPVFRSFIPLFHIVTRIVVISSNSVAFTVIAIASSMNTLFFIVLHDKLYARILLQPNTDIILQVVIVIVAFSTIIFAVHKLLKTQNLHTAIFSGFMIQMSELVFFVPLTSNADRYAFIVEFFVVAILSVSVCLLISTQIQRSGYLLENFADLQEVSANRPVLLVCFAFAFAYLLAIPLPYYFDLQPIMLVSSVLPLLPFFQHELAFIFGHIVFASLMIPQTMVFCKMMVHCFAFPREISFYQQFDGTSGMSRLMISVSLIGLIAISILFGVTNADG